MNIIERAKESLIHLIGSGLFLITMVATIAIYTTDAQATQLPAEPVSSDAIISLIDPNASVPLTEEAAENWQAVLLRDQEGYFAAFCAEVSNQESPLLAYVDIGASRLNVRSGPGATYMEIDQLITGEVMTVLSLENGWYEVDHEAGAAYISADHVLLMTKEEYVAFQQSSAYLGEQIASAGAKYLGTPYSYGSNGPSSFDCSGFTSYVYREAGYALNRSSGAQLSNGVAVDRYELQAGDLVFFSRAGSISAINHVGIYAGDGQFIHSPNWGDVVSYDSIETGYYADTYVAARRVI